ncbi:hypothetical protein ACVR0P_01755 [Streptococcus castoreus]|uniref:hypothetical protein n=1 Tax=Streptococcus castoreus TaxID=254786 RepID=UPI0004895281|nr:hypothetical protein [Streptococcus castoreus]
MTEKKLLPAISLILSMVSILDSFLIFIPYEYVQLSLIASVTSILSIFYNRKNRKIFSWLALGVSLIALAIAIYFHYYPIAIPY